MTNYVRIRGDGELEREIFFRYFRGRVVGTVRMLRRS